MRFDSQKSLWFGALERSPLGPIWIATSTDGLAGVSLWDKTTFLTEIQRRTGRVPQADQGKVSAAGVQISEYLQQLRQTFNLLIDWTVMTPFQETVLRVVADVPYGRLRTYKEIAREIGRPTAARAVGQANATNPILLVIPCHRILGADGRLHGFSAPGGLETKAWLLRQEGSWLI